MSIICSGSLFFMDFLTYLLSSLAVQLVHSKALLVPTLLLASYCDIQNQPPYLQPIVTQYLVCNKSEIWP